MPESPARGVRHHPDRPRRVVVRPDVEGIIRVGRHRVQVIESGGVGTRATSSAPSHGRAGVIVGRAIDEGLPVEQAVAATGRYDAVSEADERYVSSRPIATAGGMLSTDVIEARYHEDFTRGGGLQDPYKDLDGTTAPQMVARPPLKAWEADGVVPR